MAWKTQATCPRTLGKEGSVGWGLTPEPGSPQASGLRLSHVNPLRLPRTPSTHRAQNARLITPPLLIP